jgi:hypothetical protein
MEDDTNTIDNPINVCVYAFYADPEHTVLRTSNLLTFSPVPEVAHVDEDEDGG